MTARLDLEASLPALRALAERLLVTELPLMARVRQPVSAPVLEDVEAAAASEVWRLLERTQRPPGPVAIGAGSRGIANLEAIVRATVGAFRGRGWSPFVVPAMGSHGAATADGQAAVLAGYGVTAARIGAEVRATMDTVILGTLPDGTPWHVDRLVAEAGAFFPVGRVKPHTSFRGPVESGPAKMCCIGIGKQPGAGLMHNRGAAGLTERIPAAARLAESRGLLVGALAIIENQRDQTARVAALTPAEVGAGAEQALLDRARALLPRLPFEAVDVLIVDRMGKDISGTGMDTNVINRFRMPGVDERGRPQVTSIVVMDLTEATHGNANGLGLADYIPARLLGRVDLDAFYTNAITAGQVAIERTAFPMVLASGRDALRAALTMCGVPVAEARVAWIADTLHTELMAVSAPLLAATPGLELVSPPAPLEFDEAGELPPLT